MQHFKFSLILLFIVISSPLSHAQIKFNNSLKGAWEQKGYGHIMSIDEAGIKIFNLCKVSCTPDLEMTWKEAEYEIGFKDIASTSFTLTMGINNYNFHRLEKMPELCASSDSKIKYDPIHNFESIWHTFNEHYAYFETREINWKSYKEKYQSRLNSNTSPFELYLLLDEMLNEMNDGHVGIPLPHSLQKEYKKLKKQEKKARKKKKGKRKSINVDKTLKSLFDHYVDKPNYYNGGIVKWGKINNDVALVQINGMMAMANYGISPNAVGNRFERKYYKNAENSPHDSKDEIDGARYIMDKIVNEISDTKACIIDMRFNGGGMDEVALEILSHFTEKEVEVFSKKAYLNSGYTDKNIVSIIPAKNIYKGDVYILTSHFSASATEIFVMSSINAAPNAIRIGSNTEGIFSDILEKKLPNGWEYGLSNEVYETMDGMNYENKGIPPHHEIEYSKKGFYFISGLRDDLENGDGDKAVEKALELIKD